MTIIDRVADSERTGDTVASGVKHQPLAFGNQCAIVPERLRLQPCGRRRVRIVIHHAPPVCRAVPGAPHRQDRGGGLPQGRRSPFRGRNGSRVARPVLVHRTIALADPDGGAVAAGPPQADPAATNLGGSPASGPAMTRIGSRGLVSAARVWTTIGSRVAGRLGLSVSSRARRRVPSPAQKPSSRRRSGTSAGPDRRSPPGRRHRPRAAR